MCLWKQWWHWCIHHLGSQINDQFIIHWWQPLFLLGEYQVIDCNHEDNRSIHGIFRAWGQHYHNMSRKSHLLGILRFTEGSLPFKYLSVPIMGCKLRIDNCNDMVNQLQNYRAVLKNKVLSVGGHVQLINWVLQGKLLYWFQSLRLPMKILKVARRIIYNFILGKNWGIVEGEWSCQGLRVVWG